MSGYDAGAALADLAFDDANESAGLCGAGAKNEQNQGVTYEHDVKEKHHVHR